VIDNDLLARDAVALAQAYHDAESRIVSRIAAAISNGLEAPTWEFDSLARAQALRAEAQSVLVQTNNAFARGLSGFVENTYSQAGADTLIGLGDSVPYVKAGSLTKRAATSAISRELTDRVNAASSTMLRRVDDVYRRTVGNVVQATVARGISRKDAAREAMDVFAKNGIGTFADKSGRNWKLGDYVDMATRTGLQKAQMQGHEDTLKANDLDLVVAQPGPRACKVCDKWARSILSISGVTGKIKAANEITGGTITVTVDDTLSAARAGGFQHPNCFPSFVPVSAPTGVVGADSRWFEGEVVVVHTASGRELTVTPNHPVLTTEGWVGAGALQVGHSVVGYSGPVEDVAAPGPDHQGIEAPIGEVYEALRKSSSVSSAPVPGSAEQFHGDGVLDAEVNVVLADGLLRHDGQPSQVEQTPEGEFLLGGARLPSLLTAGATLQIVDGAGHSTDDVVRGAGGPGPLLRAGVLGAQEHGCTPVTQSDASLSEPASDRAPGDAKTAGELLDGLAGLIALDQVVKVERHDFSGHVYNLQTGGGWYTANTIVVHNCRCSLRAYIPGVTKRSDITRPPWDEEGYKAQQDQRGIENDIRAAKLEQAAAITPEDRAAAAAKTRTKQSKLRDHLDANPALKRRSDREQISARFASPAERDAYMKSRAGRALDESQRKIVKTNTAPKVKTTVAETMRNQRHDGIVADNFKQMSKPDTLATAATRANPGKVDSSRGSIAYKDYSNNCHQVTNAMEMRARGYDVIARPTANAMGRTVPEIEADWKGARKFTTLTRENAGRMSMTDWVEAQAVAYPDGARGLVTGNWDRGGGGHIFNWEKIDGKVVYHEGQTAATTSLEASRNVVRLRRDTLAIMRVDDLEPSDALLPSLSSVEEYALTGRAAAINEAKRAGEKLAQLSAQRAEAEAAFKTHERAWAAYKSAQSNPRSRRYNPTILRAAGFTTADVEAAYEARELVERTKKAQTAWRKAMKNSTLRANSLPD